MNAEEFNETFADYAQVWRHPDGSSIRWFDTYDSDSSPEVDPYLIAMEKLKNLGLGRNAFCYDEDCRLRWQIETCMLVTPISPDYRNPIFYDKYTHFDMPDTIGMPSDPSRRTLMLIKEPLDYWCLAWTYRGLLMGVDGETGRVDALTKFNP